MRAPGSPTPPVPPLPVGSPLPVPPGLAVPGPPLGLPLEYDDPEALGPYRLVARLGGGGMGTVYLGRDAGGRAVALKTMHARIAADAEFRIRFRLETDAARVIGGRHGAEVVDADPLAPTPWLATEYLLGPALDEAVERGGTLPEATARAVGAALCEALGQLHSSDVVHRDLKPSNILLTAEGPKVIDFGIARALGDERLTRTGAAAGTPAYMSPEQATGGEHGAAGDVFALAGVLVFALTGRGPFGGGQAADLLYRVRYAEPGLGGVPEALRPVLERCLHKEQAERPGTAELAALLRGDAGGPERPGGPGVGGEPAERGGEFADCLPDGVLAAISWRADAVWRIVPHREPAPPGAHPGPGAPPTAPGFGRGTPGSADGDRTRGPSRRKVLALLGGSAVGVAAAARGAWAWTADWGGDPDDFPPGRRGAPKRAWQAATLPTNGDNDLRPLAAAGLILSMDSQGLVALDAKNGDRRWHNPDIPAKHLATDGTHLYALLPEPGGPRRKSDKGSEGKGAGKGLTVCTLDPRTGTRQRTLGTLPDFDGRDVKGEFEAEPTFQPLRADGGVLYLAARTRKTDEAFEEATSGWNAVAFDLHAGRELWRKPLPDYRFRGQRSQVSGYLTARRGGRLLLTRFAGGSGSGDRGGFVTDARDARSGHAAWRGVRLASSQHSDPDTSLGDVPADGRHVYLAARQVVAHRLSDGGTAWTYDASRRARARKDVNGGPAVLFGMPAVRDGVVYVVSFEHGLIGVGALHGRLVWRQKDAPARGLHHFLGCAPLVGPRYVYVVLAESKGRTRLQAVDRKTGRSAWTFSQAGVQGVGTRLVLDEDAGRIVGSVPEGTFALPLE